MSLTSAIHVGRSALNASQIGIQVASNNLANVATRGYSRQVAGLDPLRGVREGLNVYTGRGVQVSSVERQVSIALQARVRMGIADSAGSSTTLNIFSTLEATLHELSDGDLSSQLNEFFGAWSERANLTQTSAVVVQQGVQLAGYIRGLASDLDAQRRMVENDIDLAAQEANRILHDVAELNREIVAAEVGSAVANDLRDRRDVLLEDLAALMDVAVVEQASGAVDVLAGSTPLVLGDAGKQIELQRRTADGRSLVSVVLADDGRELAIGSGRLGALLATRDGAIDRTLAELDRLTQNVIYEVNRVHAESVGERGLSSARSTNALASDDAGRPLNDPDNKSIRGLPFQIENGGFVVRVVDEATGREREVRIDVDLDGIRDDGTKGTEDDTSLADIAAQIDSVAGLNARISPQGRLEISASPGATFSFADDTSGLLAALGVNSYFTGTGASDIAVRDGLASDPASLGVGRYENGEYVENAAAMAIVGLQDSPIEGLGGTSFRQSWQASVQRVAGDTRAAGVRAEAALIVEGSLTAQRDAISGVSIDEESIDLLSYQRQYQGAARVIDIADQLLQTLLSIV